MTAIALMTTIMTTTRVKVNGGKKQHAQTRTPITTQNNKNYNNYSNDNNNSNTDDNNNNDKQ